MPDLRFRSNVDSVFVLIWAFLGVRLFPPAWQAVAQGRAVAWGQLLFPVAFLGALYYLAASTYYVVTDCTLVVRWGPFKTLVPIDSIYKLRATHTLLASPALSIDRIEVLARKGPHVVIFTGRPERLCGGREATSSNTGSRRTQERRVNLTPLPLPKLN